jgi:hypothetical protein
MFYSRARGYPVAVFSVIKYDAGEEKAKIAKLRAEDQRGLEVFELPQRDWRGKELFLICWIFLERFPLSYFNLFISLGLSYKILFRQLSEERSTDYYYERGYMYDPNALDDPEMLHGEHRYVQRPAASTGQ